MVQNKKVVRIGASVLVALLLVAGGGGLALHRHKPKPVDNGAASYNVPANSATAGQANAAGALSIGKVGSDATAQNFGQLSSSQQSGSSSGGLGVSNSGSSSGSSSGLSSASLPDPSTFAQYDKYKDSTSAMFGEVQVGTGAALGANQKAAVYYKGWLTNGQLFDESKAGSDGKVQPFVFQMGAHQVIPGWEQGLNGMKVGGVRLIIVPPSVGYGASGQASIPPNSVLVFAVQLAAVQ